MSYRPNSLHCDKAFVARTYRFTAVIPKTLLLSTFNAFAVTACKVEVAISSHLLGYVPAFLPARQCPTLRRCRQSSFAKT
jgi:hypothetical protein